MTFADGRFEPSPPPQLLSKLTDGDLVVAVDAVEAVVAKQQPRPSGRAQFRLLAWTVADARGAAAPLDMGSAETVGKRLDRQAKRVRADIESLETDHRASRLAASDFEHASMDAAIRLEIEALRSEVYIGFHEIETAGEEEAAAVPAELRAPPRDVLAAALSAARGRPMRQEVEDNVAPIPAELARDLGRDGVQALWEYRMNIGEEDGIARPFSIDDSQDWFLLLPGLVQSLLFDVRIAYSEGKSDGLESAEAADLPRLQDEVQQLRARVRDFEHLERQIAQLDMRLTENERL